MNEAQAAWVFSGLLFCVFVYVVNWHRVHGQWPSVRNPFYTKPKE